MFKRTLTKEEATARIKELKILVPFLADYRARFHGRQLASFLKLNHATVALTLKELEEKKFSHQNRKEETRNTPSTWTTSL